MTSMTSMTSTVDDLRIIGLTGLAGSGKDTAAKALIDEVGYVRVAFADYLKRMCLGINPMVAGTRLNDRVQRDGWDETKRDPLVRRFLQDWGSTVREIDPVYWIRNLDRDIWMDNATPFHNRIVVTDVRYENEARYVKSLPGSKIVKIVRPGVTCLPHPSEAGFSESLVDATFMNDKLEHDLTSGIVELEKMLFSA